jgi:hypothetical protein
MKKTLLVGAIVLFLQDTAKSCEYCFISEHGYVFDMNRTLIRLDSRFQSFSGLTKSPTSADDVTATYTTMQFTINYASGSWGYTVSLPYVYRFQKNTYVGAPALHYEHLGREVSTVDSSSVETQSARGIGDAVVLVRHAVLQQSGETFASAFVQAGVKLATGFIGVRDAYGFLIHPHLQAGTGTTLALIGASGSYGTPKQSLDGSVLAGIPVHAFGPFREAGSINYDLTYRFRILPEDAEDGPMLIQHLGIIGRVSWKERYNGVYIADSGGHYLFVNAGLTFIPLPGFNIDLFAQFPVIKQLTGNQLDEQFRLASGIQVAL